MPAASVDRTAAALRQARRRAAAVTAVGVVSVVATGALGMVMGEADAELRATGITTVGTVVDVYPDSRYSTGGLDVRFAVRGESATRYLSVGSYASDYVNGQQVVVLYDRLAPNRFTVDDVSYEPPWTFWPIMAAIFGVLLAAPTSIWMLLRSRRTRRVLEEGSWEPVRVRVWVDDRSSAFITDGGQSWHSWSDARWGGPRIDLRRLRDWWLSRPEAAASVATPDLGPAADIDSPLEAEPGEVSTLEDAGGCARESTPSSLPTRALRSCWPDRDDPLP